MQNLDRFLFMVEIDWKSKPNNDHIKNFEFIDESIEFAVSKNKSVCLVSGKFPQEYSEILMQLSSNFNCFLEFPIILEKNAITGNIVGSHEDLNRFLDFIEGWGAEFKIISKRKYLPKGSGVLSELTLQQLKSLEKAVEMGYFEFPKRNNARDISKKLKISHATFIEHLRKAEKTVFTNLFRI
jgi:predicted DNA binding protein